MANQITSVNVFLLLFKGSETRFNKWTQDQLLIYESIFGPDFWKHAMTEFTFWSSSNWARKNREKKCRRWITIHMTYLLSNFERTDLLLNFVVHLGFLFQSYYPLCRNPACNETALSAEERRHIEWNQAYRNHGFSIPEEQAEIPTVFIDPVLPYFTEAVRGNICF